MMKNMNMHSCWREISNWFDYKIIAISDFILKLAEQIQPQLFAALLLNSIFFLNPGQDEHDGCSKQKR